MLSSGAVDGRRGTRKIQYNTILTPESPRLKGEIIPSETIELLLFLRPAAEDSQYQPANARFIQMKCTSRVYEYLVYSTQDVLDYHCHVHN